VRLVSINFTQTPINDMIVVELDAQPAAKGRIKLPDWQRHLIGTVIAVGPGRPLYTGGRAPMSCQVGDKVGFAPTAGMDFEYTSVGQSIRMMRDPDVDVIYLPVDLDYTREDHEAALAAALP
jgi:chaperonin GroES